MRLSRPVETPVVVPFRPRPEADAFPVTLNPDQERAYAEVDASIVMRRQHLITGFAGSGKTTLMQVIASRHAPHREVVLTAPTHKACEVLARKLRAAGIETPVQTIHSLLSLRPRPQGERQVFVRAKRARSISADLVIIDEASMLDSSMMTHIGRWLGGVAVVFCGDAAQLPPVGETGSLAFNTMPASHLGGIVRQAEGNPIITAAGIIRASQGHEMDWTWTAPARSGNLGVFNPGTAANDWMKKGFLSSDFARDPDQFRILTWTNDRVAMFNNRVRGWFGYDLSVPFVPGERALIRSPLVVENEILIATNEEVTVLAIEADEMRGVASWAIRVRTGQGVEHDINTPRDMDGYRIALARLADDAKGDGYSWDAYHEFKAAFLQMQALYALTTHAAQGSTFKTAFVDMPEMRRWMRKMPDEGSKGLYVAATRASHSLILVGG